MNTNIFREYDIRGIYEKDLTSASAYTIGKAFGSYARLKGLGSVVVGHDNRNSYKVLYPSVLKGLKESGINVIDLGLVTTPMVYFAKIFLNISASLMLTASHNPKEYNGFKLSLEKEDSLYGDKLRDFRDYTLKGSFLSGNGNVYEIDIKKDYFAKLKECINLGNRKIKVVIDLGNGTGCHFIKDVMDMFDIEYELLYSESDSNFPNHTPDPSVKENMIDLGKKVAELGYDLGIALDGDCDRFGVTLEDGTFIPADYVMLIIYRSIVNSMKEKKALFDVKCSKTLIDELNKLGIEPIMNKTGAVYCRSFVNKMNLDFGGEYSGHLVFNDKYLGYDDGIYGALRFIEILSNTDKKVSELLLGINKYYSTDEMLIGVTDDNKFDVVEKVKKYALDKNYECNSIDGVRVTFDDGWALIRASNTGPNLTVRFESESMERLKEIESEFKNKINEFTFSGTPHNRALKEDISDVVIMAGDPKRVKYIADEYLEDAYLVNDVRLAYAYTGFYKGRRITVMAHGMGCASMGIYAYELFKYYEVDKIIRIGSCGGYDKDLKLFDIILTSNVYSESNFALTFNNEDKHIVKASEKLNDVILKKALENDVKLVFGNTVCSDVFDLYMTNQDEFLKRIPFSVVGCEMEAFALIYLADYFQKDATCLMSVVDSKYIDKVATPLEREQGLNKMILLALDSAISL